MVNRIYPSDLQLNNASASDTAASFLDLHLSISNGYVSSKIYDKRGDFGFDIVWTDVSQLVLVLTDTDQLTLFFY